MINSTILSIARNMKDEFEISTRNIEHNLSKGTQRERIVISFLRKYLPFKYAVTSGIIINAEGNQSRQQDIIIYDKINCIRLFGNELDREEQVFIPIESVICVIEVKSTLGKDEIKKVIENYNSVTTLRQKPLPINPVYTLHSDHFRPAGFCFAFTSHSDLASNALEFKNQRLLGHMEKHLSGIIILDKGVIQYNRIEDVNYIDTNPTANTSESCHVCSDVGQSLQYFTYMLTHTLNSIVVEQPDFLHYMKSSKFYPFDSSFEMSPELLTDQMKIGSGNEGIFLKKASELARLVSKLYDGNSSIPLNKIISDDRIATLYFCIVHANEKVSSATVNDPNYVVGSNGDRYPRKAFEESVLSIYNECVDGKDIVMDSDQLSSLQYHFITSSTSLKSFLENIGWNETDNLKQQKGLVDIMKISIARDAKSSGRAETEGLTI